MLLCAWLQIEVSGSPISPFCIGKLRRGQASAWLQELLQELCEAEAADGPRRPEASTGKLFALLATWADSGHVTMTAGSRGGVTAEGDAAANRRKRQTACGERSADRKGGGQMLQEVRLAGFTALPVGLYHMCGPVYGIRVANGSL